MANLDDGQIHTLARALSKFEADADVVLLDMAAGLSRQTLAMLRASDRILIIATPDIAAMTDAYAIMKLLSRCEPRLPLGLVVNRARSAAEAEQVTARLTSMAEQFLGRKLACLGWIPDEPSLERWAIAGRPFVLGDPQSTASQALRILAERVLASPLPATPTGHAAGYFDRLCEMVGLTEVERVRS